MKSVSIYMLDKEAVRMIGIAEGLNGESVVVYNDTKGKLCLMSYAEFFNKSVLVEEL